MLASFVVAGVAPGPGVPPPPGVGVGPAEFGVTVTLKVHDCTLPDLSVTVPVTGVVPTPKIEPDAML